MNRYHFVAALSVILPLASTVYSADIDPVVNQLSLLGIGHANGLLKRFDFPTGQTHEVGPIRAESGETLTGILASAYFPGFQQLHAFWTDPADQESKLVFIDTETGEARVTPINLGPGTVRGAVASIGQATLTRPDGSTYPQATWRVFGLQDNTKPTSPRAMLGMANIHYGNNPSYVFTLETPTGTISHDDLGKATVNPEGVLYEGPATSIVMKPKGNGNQNGLSINGEVFSLDNGKDYVFTGEMTVKLFNNHVKNTQPNGQWWIEIDAQTATVTQNGVVISTPPAAWVPTSRLFALHTQIGLSTTILELDRVYHGLATLDGVTFYAGSGGELYRIDTLAKTETLIASLPSGQITELEFAGSTLMAWDDASDTLFAIDPQTGAVIGSGIEVGMADLGSMNFLPTREVPSRTKLSFD